MTISAIIVLALVVVVALAVASRFLRRPTAMPYEPTGKLLTPAELSFYGVLKQALGDEYVVMAKVRLADVVAVKKGLGGQERQRAFNRIQSKHLDFVVCRPEDMAVLFAVELDDSSHERTDRQDRDAFVEEAMRAAGVKLHRFPVKRAYSLQDVRAALVGGAGQAPAPVEASAGGAPVCPKCGAAMVRRTARTGANAGSEFWGCPNYPRCKGVVA